MTVPGLGPLAAGELAGLDGVERGGRGHDGRADLVLIAAGPRARREALSSRLIEDLFVEVGRATRAEGDDPRRIAARLWPPHGVERALSVWAQSVAPLRGRMTFRAIVRVLHERTFLRTDLRRELTQCVARDRPRWRATDPAQLEVWACEYRPGAFIAGLRLSDAGLRQLSTADARRIALPDGSIGACVSNLPFGRQFAVRAGRSWLANVLGELSRVTRRGGRVVLLAPPIPPAVMPARLRLDQRIPIRLLGTPASIWAFTRLG